jgi:hypothetical protein
MKESDNLNEDEIQKLVENSRDGGSSRLEKMFNEYVDAPGWVTYNKLTQLKCGFILKNKPLIEYLDDGEQPEYIYHSAGAIRPAMKVNLGDEAVALIESNRSAICITDKRVLVIGRNDGDDISVSYHYDEVLSVEWDKLAMVNPFGRSNHTISLFVDPMVITSGGNYENLNMLKRVMDGNINQGIGIDIILPNTYSNTTLQPAVQFLQENCNRYKHDKKNLSESSVQNESDPTTKLKRLKKLLDDDVIDEDEFKSKKQELLDRI